MRDGQLYSKQRHHSCEDNEHGAWYKALHGSRDNTRREIEYATMDDLKAIDIWALGMTFFRIISPDVEFPYEMELNSSPEKAPDLASKF